MKKKTRGGMGRGFLVLFACCVLSPVLLRDVLRLDGFEGLFVPLQSEQQWAPVPSQSEQKKPRGDADIYPESGDDSNLLLGNPSGANGQDSNNFLLVNRYYSLSYNNSTRIPNWVSWHLGKRCLGRVKRTGPFTPNHSLPEAFYKVLPSDYKNSGFDRGHHCPSADRTNSVKANQSTFLMTNIAPQAPRNNRITWKALEDYTREMVLKGNEVYIICGTYGVGGKGKTLEKVDSTISARKVRVPSNFWKILVVLKDGDDDLNRIKKNEAEIIAVDVPNDDNLNGDWRRYVTSVEKIEKKTGYRFFKNIPMDSRKKLRYKRLN